MFVGHLGVGLALKGAAPRLNLGWWFLCVMLLDVVLWLFVLAGVERVHIPPDYAERRYLTFDFPYSHSIAAAFGWAALTFLISRLRASTRSAMLLALATLSHIALDWLVHSPDIHVVGHKWQPIGLGLWNVMPAALAVELGLLVIGYIVYIRTTPARSRRATFSLGLVLAIIAIVALTGQLFAPPPNSPREIAVGSLGLLVLLFALVGWIDRWRTPLLQYNSEGRSPRD